MQVQQSRNLYGQPGSPSYTTAANVLYLDLKKWKKEGEKKNGARSSNNKLVGVYSDRSNPQRRYLFKHDDVPAYNIAEFFAYKFSCAMNPKNSYLFTPVYLAFANGQVSPDNTGANVYVASEYLPPGSRPLYEDSYDAFNFMDEYQHLRKGEVIQRPAQRPKWPTSDAVIGKMLCSGRYPRDQFAKIFFTALITQDMDVHSENIQITPLPNQSPAFEVRFGDQDETMYAKVRPVRIDYGGALRGMDGSLHLHAFYNPLLHIPNYFSTYPQTLFESCEFLQEAVNFSCFPKQILEQQLALILKEVAAFYGPEPLLAFADLIGAPTYFKNTLTLDKDDLLEHINQFLSEVMQARTIAADQIAVEIASKLRISTEELNWMKKNAQAQWNALLPRERDEKENEQDKTTDFQSSIDDCTDELELNKIDSELDVILLAISETYTPADTHIKTIQEKLHAMCLEKEDEDSNARHLLTQEAQRLYAQENIKYFLESAGLTKQFDQAIHQFPAQVLHLHVIVHEAVKEIAVQNEQRKQATRDRLASLFNTLSEQSDSPPVSPHAGEILLDFAIIALGEYEEQLIYQQTQWPRLLADNGKANLEKKQLRALNNLLQDNDTYTLDQQLMAVLAVLACENKLPRMRFAILKEFRDYLGDQAFELENVITTLLVKSFGYDPSILHNTLIQADIASQFPRWNTIATQNNAPTCDKEHVFHRTNNC